ncbi:histone lysine demethylase JMJC1/KDM5D/JARID1D [Cardiosporidium cionae]|uniref:Histone lysine demethylase JMJC1/KDM5D/JARID1D n=1 Tax=Cardiosporidium cionae TaxID=476202 RepID=A0ABQ7JD91_9APIC|nr:histone lysine demethylase JMJC1/KDM5D/JARID1D [Cardiosporidium cionae]|eukprot:KAF8821913.1 histone lysine demethylase JMJC1/KDM5D/JARID1D [Cardiosporidium cionae]
MQGPVRCIPTDGFEAVRERPKRLRKTNVFYQPEKDEFDRDVRAAIKKSMVDKKTTKIHFSKDLPEIPSVQPTEDLFKEPVKLFEKYHEYGRKYGAVKLIPPAGWKPPFSLDLESMEFQVREQHIHKLSTGKSFSHPEKCWRLQDLKEENERFIKSQFKVESPSLEEVEQEYWRIVEHATEKVTVRYAADLKTNSYGSGFPKDPESRYTKHPWNLTQLPCSEGSLLKYCHRDVPGITSPWLYLGMTFSCFCWHTEDNFFASVNYQHFGSPKVWYVVPPSRAASVERLLKNYVTNGKSDYALHSLTVQLSPSILLNNKVPVYRAIQNENEFILLWPRTFHAGFNSGLNCNEACNIAPAFWLDTGYRSIDAYRYLRSSCIPFYQLLIRSANCHTELDSSSLYYLCKALLMFFNDEWHYRNMVDLPQLPFHLSRAELQRVRDNRIKSLTEMALFREGKRCFVLNLENVTPVPLALDLSDSNLLQCCASIAKVPSKDCDNCQTACFSGCVICPHVSDVICAPCLEVHQCSCKEKIYLYRYSLAILKRIVDIVSLHYEKLVRAVGGRNRLAEEFLNTNLPSDIQILKFEEAKGLSKLRKLYNTWNANDTASSPFVISKGNSSKSNFSPAESRLFEQTNKSSVAMGSKANSTPVSSPVGISIGKNTCGSKEEENLESSSPLLYTPSPKTGKNITTSGNASKKRLNKNLSEAANNDQSSERSDEALPDVETSVHDEEDEKVTPLASCSSKSRFTKNKQLPAASLPSPMQRESAISYSIQKGNDSVSTIIPFAQKLSWKYLKITFRSEQEEDDDKFLPSFHSTPTPVKSN